MLTHIVNESFDVHSDKTINKSEDKYVSNNSIKGDHTPRLGCDMSVMPDMTKNNNAVPPAGADVGESG